jgi:Mrp family chromosome partitioning ATPase
MFDILIVDTPPVGVVSDTLIISENADAVVYLVRSGYSKKNTLKTPVELNHEKKLPQLSVLLNDVNIYRSYRDYHYGYGYTEKPRPWYKRLV